MMDAGQSTQTGGFQRTASSPFKETRTRAVREYEQTIDQLRKENFDLKLKIYLTEEENRKKYHNKAECNDETESTFQVIVNLRVETETLRRDLEEKEETLQSALLQTEKLELELNKKSEELQSALEQAEKQTEELIKKDEIVQNALDLAEKYASDIKQLQDINTIKQSSTSEDQISVISNKYQKLKTIVVEKNNQLEDLNAELDKFRSENRNLKTALRGCAKRYADDIKLPSSVRPLVKNAVEAALDHNEENLNTALEQFKSSLLQLMVESSSSSSLESYNNNDEESHKKRSSKEQKQILKSWEEKENISSHSAQRKNVRKPLKFIPIARVHQNVSI